MSKVERRYCEDCQEFRPFEYTAPCSGLETCVWFVLGLLLWWPLWVVMVLRHVSFKNPWHCQSCGGKRHSESPKHKCSHKISGISNE